MRLVIIKAVNGRHSVEIPIGKTVIGRGPLLQIKSTAVSRQHGELELSADGKLTLRSIHGELPCFYKKAAAPESELKPYSCVQLCPGDTFSLLPQCVESEFMVESELPHLPAIRTPDSADATEKQSESDDDDKVMDDGKKTAAAITEEKRAVDEVVGLQARATVPPVAYVPQVNSSVVTLKKKRRLPEWISGNKSPATASETKIIRRGGSAAQSSKPLRSEALASVSRDGVGTEDIKPSTSSSHLARNRPSRRARQPTPIDYAAYSESDEDSDYYGAVNKIEKEDKRRTGTTKRSPQSSPERKRKVNPSTHSVRSISSSSSDNDTPDVPPGRSLRMSPDENSEVQLKLRDKEQHLSAECSSSEEEMDSSLKPSRRPCVYGTACYRKNPMHFVEFAHPGDEDCSAGLVAGSRPHAASARVQLRASKAATRRRNRLSSDSDEVVADEGKDREQDPDWNEVDSSDG